MHALLIQNENPVKLHGSCIVASSVGVHELTQTQGLILPDVAPASLWHCLLDALVVAAKCVSTPTKC